MHDLKKKKKKDLPVVKTKRLIEENIVNLLTSVEFEYDDFL